MRKRLVTMFFAAASVLLTAGPRKIVAVAEDGFSELFKEDFHAFAFSHPEEYECILSSDPNCSAEPVLKIGGGAPPPDSETVPFAVRGNLLLVHGQNSFDDLPAEKAREILRNRFTEWPGVGVRVRQVCFVTGTEDPEVIRANVPGRPSPVVTETAALAAELVADDVTAVAVLPLVSAVYSFPGTRILTVGGVAATPETVLNGTYPLSKRYFLSVRRDAPPEIKAIYEKLRAREVRVKIIQKGAVPAPSQGGGK